MSFGSTTLLIELPDVLPRHSLVDLFAAADTDPQLASLRALLLEYQSSLRSTKLTHYTLAGVPLPDTLDPSIPHPLPNRARVFLSLFVDTLSSLVRLPFFILPLIVHLPIYLISKYSLRFSDLEEDAAQNKIALGLVLAVLTYPTLFIAAWFLLFTTPVGGVLAAGFVWLFAVYHNTLIDDNCAFLPLPRLPDAQLTFSDRKSVV